MHYLLDFLYVLSDNNDLMNESVGVLNWIVQQDLLFTCSQQESGQDFQTENFWNKKSSLAAGSTGCMV